MAYEPGSTSRTTDLTVTDSAAGIPPTRFARGLRAGAQRGTMLQFADGEMGFYA
jgi:hypothetical protein